jgi:hypothetical protein
MEVSEEHIRKIAEIQTLTNCRYDFVRCKPPFDNLCKARDEGLKNFANCLEEDTTECQFRVPYSKGAFCSCQVRVYIAKELKV